MRFSSKQRRQWVTGLFLVLPVLFFYLGQYFYSDAFLARFRLVSFLQNGGLQGIAIVLVITLFIATLYYLWNTLKTWTNGQKIVSSVLLFLYPIVVLGVLSLVHFDLKLWEAKEEQIEVTHIPNSGKYLHIIQVTQPGLFRKQPIFDKTILCKRYWFSPVMKIVGEYDCIRESITPGAGSVQVNFYQAEVVEGDSLEVGCQPVIVY